MWPLAMLTLYRTFRARGARLRAWHEARRALGRFRAAPLHTVLGAYPGVTPFGLVVNAGRLQRASNIDVALARAERVLAGEQEAFRQVWHPLPNSPETWLTYPSSGIVAAANDAWWKVTHLDSSAGDIKDLWEPARFTWSYDLVRGYLLTGDDRFAAAFHARLADWVESSPPFRGVHWSCGQETAIRAAALLYAEANLAAAPSSSPAAMALLRDVLAWSGERVRDGIGYAISQRNNHAISEAAGLILLGARFQGEHPEAGAWLGNGHRLLERLIREQFAPDGWYIQHSFTYLRLALDQCVLAERALRHVGLALSAGAAARLRAAVELLLAVMEPATGLVPNHGANDGAFVHPITLAGYRDFRPVVTAVCALWRIPLPANIATDAEVLAWLGAEAPPVAPPTADGVFAGDSGWAAARIGDTAVFLRAGSYTSRPGHLDPLHLDVRFGGREVVVDAGTFAYNAPTPWRNGLAAAAVHNGPVLDGREPGLRGPRFLWYIWPDARLLSADLADGGFRLVAEIPGEVRREVLVLSGEVKVQDTVLREDAEEAVVQWLLHPAASPAQVEAPGASVAEAREGEVAGWFSPGYGVRLPSRTVRLSWDPRRNPSIRTVIRPARPDPSSGLTGTNKTSQGHITI